MNKVTVLNQIPEKSIISKDFGKIHYSDSYVIQVTANDSVDAITTKIFSVPQWVKGLLKFRNTSVKVLKSLLKRYSNEKRIFSNKRPMQERFAELP